MESKANKRDNIEEGLALFLVKKDEKQDYIKIDYVPEKFKSYSSIALPVMNIRNTIIILTFIEIFSAILGFSYFFIRRSIVYIIVNLFALLISILGVFSSLYINEIGLIIYSILTISLPGTFFAYQILELFIIADTSNGNKDRLNDNVLLLIFSLPYLYDFSVGIITLFFMSKIANFNETLKEIINSNEDENKKMLEDKANNILKKYSETDLNDLIKKRSGINTCVICCENMCNVLILPCKHLIMCEACSTSHSPMLLINQSTCPICRKKIEKLERVYI